MDKLLLIINREYLSRVRKKSFLLATLLTPIGIGLLVFLSAYIGATGGVAERNILLIDDNQVLNTRLENFDGFTFSFVDEDISEWKENYQASRV